MSEYRVINSEEELDALPHGPIIKDQQGAMTKDDDDPPYPNWYVGDNAYEVRLPAIVLWEPNEGEA